MTQSGSTLVAIDCEQYSEMILYVTKPAKINHMSVNYTQVIFLLKALDMNVTSKN